MAEEIKPIRKLNCGTKFNQKKESSRFCEQFGPSEAKKRLAHSLLPF